MSRVLKTLVYCLFIPFTIRTMYMTGGRLLAWWNFIQPTSNWEKEKKQTKLRAGFINNNGWDWWWELKRVSKRGGNQSTPSLGELKSRVKHEKCQQWNTKATSFYLCFCALSSSHFTTQSRYLLWKLHKPNNEKWHKTATVRVNLQIKEEIKNQRTNKRKRTKYPLKMGNLKK